MVDRRDVQRAADRAAVLAKAGLPVLAYAGGQRATAGAVQLAEALNVTLLLDIEAGAEDREKTPVIL